MRRRTMVTAVAIATLATTIGAAGPADAAFRTQNIGMNCWSLNPNIADVPFYAGVSVRTDTTRPGLFSIWADSKSLFPYTTDSTVTVTSLATNRSQTFHRRWQHGLADLPGYRIDDLRGSGPIRVTVRSVSHGLIPTLPAPVCSGTATV
ncbi:hypothetical protein [Gordonia insulae]|uniref:Uncharacterized protein n=1 Tax=Gordonia insulae TaxID=2420509 RepID=A0A3G8JQZ7_9ACTN|nr:hypothetical protein [Gordonia insulae]AZG47338.1 hypothetical protein D7316_03947 [Gordonia insulae]